MCKTNGDTESFTTPLLHSKRSLVFCSLFLVSYGLCLTLVDLLNLLERLVGETQKCYDLECCAIGSYVVYFPRTKFSNIWRTRNCSSRQKGSVS